MKKILLFLSIMLGVQTANAQTIHWLTFIDTTDPSVGKYDVVGRNVLYSRVINPINSALATAGYKNHVQDYYGTATSPENCKKAVESLQITNPDDIIVFYYIGHGARPNSDKDYIRQNPWPQMQLAHHNFNDKLMIPLSWVDQQLTSKGARLAVTIGMCCNSFMPELSKKEVPAFTVTYGPTYMSSQKIDNIKKLFLDTTGSVLATSAKPGQSSYPGETLFGDMDIYTAIWASFFENNLDRPISNLSWDYFLNSVSQIIDKLSKSDQTPFHRTNLKAAAKPAQTTRPAQQQSDPEITKQMQNNKQATNNLGSREWLNSFEDNLLDLINTSLSQSDRIEMEKGLNNLFAPGAKVRFLGQDSDAVIDREDSDVFLGRLATSKLLLNVVVVDANLNSDNKITSLKVREIYKQ